MVDKKKIRKPGNFGRPPDPDDHWNKAAPSATEALLKCGRILKKLDDASPEVWNAAFKFFDSVKTRVTEMQKTLQEGRPPTDGQVSALTNWEAGIDKWLKQNEKQREAAVEKDEFA